MCATTDAMSTCAQHMAAKADAIAASPERIALMKRAKLETAQKLAAIRAKHAPAGALVRLITDEFGNHKVYTVTSAPSGAYVDHVACDWCGVIPGGSAHWLIESDGW